MLISYARVSTQDQNLKLQREAFGQGRMQGFEDKISGRASSLTSGVPPKEVAENLGVYRWVPASMHA